MRGNLLCWCKTYLSNRSQRVFIQGCSPHWATTTAGFPKGFGLGPLLFLISINDLSGTINSTRNFFAEDTCIYASTNYHTKNDFKSNIINEFNKNETWSKQWMVKFNALKTDGTYHVNICILKYTHDNIHIS